MESGRFVTIGNMKYLALDSTPSEFVETGLYFKCSDRFKSIWESQQIQVNLRLIIILGNVSSSASYERKWKSPHALSVSGSGNGVSWGNHSDSILSDTEFIVMEQKLQR